MNVAAPVEPTQAPVAPTQAPVATPPPACPAHNTVFVELLGNGLTYSVNYERILTTWPVGLRAGASFITVPISDARGSGNLTLATFPLVATYYYGPNRHKFEVGLGATVLYSIASSDATGTRYGASGFGLGATGVFGYRYLPEVRGITFGVAFTPLLRPGKAFLPWGGVNVGYAF